MKSLFSICVLVVIMMSCIDGKLPPLPAERHTQSQRSTADIHARGQYKVIVYEVRELGRRLYNKFGNYTDNTKISGFYFTPIPHSQIRNRYIFKVEAVSPNGGIHGRAQDTIHLDRTAVIVAEVYTDPNISAAPFYVFQRLGRRGFLESDLQYYSNFRKFDKAFLSKADLNFMFQTGKFIGISGSYVNSGNIQVIEILDPDLPGTLVDRPSVNYFNLKFAAFEINDLSKKLSVILQDEIIKLAPDIGLDPNEDFHLISAANVDGTSIPATTFSAPCPPRWVPR